MPSIQIQPITITLTGATASALTCASTTGLLVGMKGWAVQSDGSGNLAIIISKVDTSTTFLCQSLANVNNAGGADLSLYDGGKIYFDKQIVESPSTKASGTSTGTGSEQTIVHSLVGTPSQVSVVPTVTGTTVASTWADGTNIYTTVTSGKTYRWSATL